MTYATDRGLSDFSHNMSAASLGKRTISTPTVLTTDKPDSVELFHESCVSEESEISNLSSPAPIKDSRSFDSQRMDTSDIQTVAPSISSRPLSFDDCADQAFNCSNNFSLVAGVIGVVRVANGNLQDVPYWAEQFGYPKELTAAVLDIFKNAFPSGIVPLTSSR